jgi:hypothetical protein
LDLFIDFPDVITVNVLVTLIDLCSDQKKKKKKNKMSPYCADHAHANTLRKVQKTISTTVLRETGKYF